MRLAALSICCAAGLLAIGVGCSGDGHPSSTATTIRPAVKTGKTGPKPAPCPTRYKDTALATLNAGVAGAGNAQVPFAATKWWTCQWDGRGKQNGLSGYMSYGVGSFVSDTNRLTRTSHRPQQRANPRDKLIASQPIYLTFASDSHQIVLRFDPYGAVTNGYVVAQPTCEWEANFLSVSCGPPPSTAS